ncbi:MAG: DegT/DnrJ/EryC1/StrS aminotransferase family protein [Gammaproteobacteria bacterium]|nr:DegT/DnrJ/EryC1/StrS aminotransferase family protein [Gammaproteobacteria bacterium]MBU1646789.1 DegT/DnrJ/EryC1/StrS aminotransferase family protein [Gammaproteobacteria bacterium]MBU1971557.1 DegT/DnrJ/EryC1/StrS aminotransferase family protein [Gammaproteobacteria bacterium]
MTDFLPFTRPSIDEATIAAVADVLRSGWITSGPKVQAFEAALSEYCGGRTVRAFSSGTATLEVALRLAGVGAHDDRPGGVHRDTVITTPLTWVATANVILEVGATPVFVDIDPATRNIDLDKLESAIRADTKAIIPVDLAGLPVDRNRLYAIAERHGLRVIEDAAQSLGASWNGQFIGTTGDFVSFSFHANKNLTTGEGGALVLPADVDPALCERLRLQGVKRFPDGGMDVDVLGGKSNLTDIAAAIGLGQLRHLAEFTERRRHLARRYFERLAPAMGALGLELPPADFENSNWHMFQPLLPEVTDRGRFVAAMKAYGIGVGVHYPALHLFSLYRALGFREGDFPEAERVGRRTVTLPLFPAMSEADVDRVCAAIEQTLPLTT